VILEENISDSQLNSLYLKMNEARQSSTIIPDIDHNYIQKTLDHGKPNDL